MKRRVQKMKITYHLTANSYNITQIHKQTHKCLQHYKIVIRPEAIYACECLAISPAEKVLKVEREILRKIYGPKQIKYIEFRLR